MDKQTQVKTVAWLLKFAPDACKTSVQRAIKALDKGRPTVARLWLINAAAKATEQQQYFYASLCQYMANEQLSIKPEATPA